jgi:chemotaxis protein histidine kinase CheA
VVDSVVGTEEIVVKPMHGGLKPLKIYSGPPSWATAAAP